MSFRGQAGKNDIIWLQANIIWVQPDQQVNKAEEITYLSINIGSNILIQYSTAFTNVYYLFNLSEIHNIYSLNLSHAFYFS